MLAFCRAGKADRGIPCHQIRSDPLQKTPDFMNSWRSIAKSGPLRLIYIPDEKVVRDVNGRIVR